MKVICLSQARMGSTRLPGKVLKSINNKTLLQYHCQRLAQVKEIDQHIIATSDLSEDQAIADFCKAQNIAFFCGSETNVLNRFYECARAFNTNENDLIIRVTGDCPLIAPELVSALISHHIQENLHGITNIDINSFPRGLDAEIFSMKALAEANSQANSDYETEHVTPYFYQHPEKFPVNSLRYEQIYTTKVDDSQNFRLCVDEVDDFALIQQLVKQYPNDIIQAGAKNIMNFLREHPEIASLNQTVKQKTH